MRQLNFCGKQVIDYLNKSYANHIGTCISNMTGDESKEQTSVSLVIGISNYSSEVGKECMHQFTSDLPITGDDESKLDEGNATPQAVALTFGYDILINNNSLSTEFGSPYLLAHILEKFINGRKTVSRIVSIFLNHFSPEGYQRYVQAGVC